MQYFITFIEGIITFISPCLLPMLPIYLVYFAGGDKQPTKKKTFMNAFGFIIGFSILFVLLGALAGTLGKYLTVHKNIFNIVCGALLILFGINYTGFIKIPFLNHASQSKGEFKPSGFFSSIVFGLIFAFGYSPCVGAHLSSALVLAADSQTVAEGSLLLLLFSLGLGLPFLICAVLIDNLKGTLNFIKKHYNIINPICGILLIIIGILMATGLLSRILQSFSGMML
ncbi:MAG: cytochrome c biogenesis protein CcdA [Ruminococcaceae bacterium]|nr:cytochrome c biogenesis protein CcdA [Oscillospiraceae bacterium]